jgi:DNA-directed RNA polymerase subunit H (RpoH/RPB5)
MGKVQDYLKQKKIQELGLPKMYIVKSDRTGIDSPIEVQVNDIKENLIQKRYFDNKWEEIPYKKYIFDQYPYEIDIELDKISNVETGYSTGFGDLWEWSYFCTLSKEEADKYYIEEFERVKNKYLVDKKRINDIDELIDILTKIKNRHGNLPIMREHDVKYFNGITVEYVKKDNSNDKSGNNIDVVLIY